MKDPMEITRLTTDEPENNTETMLNFAYAKDGNVFLRGVDVENVCDMGLCEYVSREANEKGCKHTPEDIIEGACMECDCEIATLYWVAAQAAELRGRLKRYEDAGITLNDLENEPLTIEELKEMSGKPYWHVSLMDSKKSPDHWRKSPDHWRILPDDIAKNPQDYYYGEIWFAYRREVKNHE